MDKYVYFVHFTGACKDGTSFDGNTEVILSKEITSIQDTNRISDYLLENSKERVKPSIPVSVSVTNFILLRKEKDA